MTILYWFTLDLRLDNNSGFLAACQKAARNQNGEARVTPLYILDNTDPWAAKGAQHWWLHHSLSSLSESLKEKGSKLVLRSGSPLIHLEDLLQQQSISAIYFSRAYDPHNIELQNSVNKLCGTLGVECRRFSGRLLQEPENIFTGQGQPFKVFTPFSKKFLALLETSPPKTLPKKIRLAAHKLKSEKLNEWQLQPKKPNWAIGFPEHWQPGEAGAKRLLELTVDSIVESYAEQRDIPANKGTSRLSPYLHFGEISVAKVWHEVGKRLPFDVAFPYLRQLIWREFSYSLLYHWPHIPTKAFNPSYENFPWTNNQPRILAWQRGQTGYPLIDAGMRQLWQTGWMHNRVRMVAASFLTKHLLIHWKVGADWFWDTLLDADLANNAVSWQWVAGSGADAAPYFRIFNPITQSEKFDPEGNYIRQWVPEIANLSNKFIHKPWLAPAEQRNALVKSYPPPIIEHSQGRSDALLAYESIKKINGE